MKNENAEQIPGEQINSYQASSYDGGYLALHAFAKQVQIYRVSGNFDGTVHNLTAGSQGGSSPQRYGMLE